MPLSQRLYKTEAIILRSRKLGEADRVLTLFTPTLGKIEAKARGVRKTTSRLSGHLQPLMRGMLSLARGHSLDVVTGVETLEAFRPLREDLDLLSRALYVAEITDRMTAEAVHNYPTYRYLLETLQRLQNAPDPDAALRYFEMKLLDQAGFRPEIERCVACESALEPVDNFFVPVAGGAVCRGCVAGMAGPRVLTVNALKVLRLLQRGPYNEVARVRMNPELAEEIEKHLRGYIISVLERDVNSAAFIERLRRDGPRMMVEV